MCGSPMRPCSCRRRYRPRPTWIRPRSSQPPVAPAPMRSIRATASCRRTPALPSASCRRRPHLHRPGRCRRMRAHGRQDPRARLRRRARACRSRPASSPAGRGRAFRRVRAQVGFPLLIKAAAGGGGKGMRIVRSRAAAAPRACALAAGRGAALLRRRPGVCRALHRAAAPHRGAGARATGRAMSCICSSASARLQRRYQKIIEESPAPNLPRGAARGDLRRGRAAWRGRRATAMPARSSSCWRRTARSISWR